MSSKITQVYTSRGRKKGGLELIPNSEIEKYHFPMCDSQKLEHRKFSMSINGNIEDSQWVPQRDTPCPTDVFNHIPQKSLFTLLLPSYYFKIRHWKISSKACYMTEQKTERTTNK